MKPLKFGGVIASFRKDKSVLLGNECFDIYLFPVLLNLESQMKECYTLAIDILKGFSHSASMCQVLLCLRGHRDEGKEGRHAK